MRDHEHSGNKAMETGWDDLFTAEVKRGCWDYQSSPTAILLRMYVLLPNVSGLGLDS